jgi:uncharacterized protein (DUF2147 family)
MDTVHIGMEQVMQANRALGHVFRIVAVFGWMAAASFPGHAQEGAPLDGEWLTKDGTTKVRFDRCDGGPCGRIVWLREPIDPATGQPRRDGKNENAALRDRPLIGLLLMAKLTQDSPTAWSGALYNPQDGRTYRGSLKRLDANRLELSGCVLAIICKSETWTRSR